MELEELRYKLHRQKRRRVALQRLQEREEETRREREREEQRILEKALHHQHFRRIYRIDRASQSTDDGETTSLGSRASILRNSEVTGAVAGGLGSQSSLEGAGDGGRRRRGSRLGRKKLGGLRKEEGEEEGAHGGTSYPCGTGDMHTPGSAIGHLYLEGDYPATPIFCRRNSKVTIDAPLSQEEIEQELLPSMDWRRRRRSSRLACLPEGVPIPVSSSHGDVLRQTPVRPKSLLCQPPSTSLPQKKADSELEDEDDDDEEEYEPDSEIDSPVERKANQRLSLGVEKDWLKDGLEADPLAGRGPGQRCSLMTYRDWLRDGQGRSEHQRITSWLCSSVPRCRSEPRLPQANARSKNNSLLVPNHRTDRSHSRTRYPKATPASSGSKGGKDATKKGNFFRRKGGGEDEADREEREHRSRTRRREKERSGGKERGRSVSRSDNPKKDGRSDSARGQRGGGRGEILANSHARKSNLTACSPEDPKRRARRRESRSPRRADGDRRSQAYSGTHSRPQSLGEYTFNFFPKERGGKAQ